MERNLVSWTLANMITVPLMAFLGLSVVALVFQLVKQAQTKPPASTSGGY